MSVPSLNLPQLLISPNSNDRPLDRHSCHSTPPNVASSGAKWAYRRECLSGNVASNRGRRYGRRTGNVTSKISQMCMCWCTGTDTRLTRTDLAPVCRTP
jgi:hypothetical protein